MVRAELRSLACDKPAATDGNIVALKAVAAVSCKKVRLFMVDSSESSFQFGRSASARAL